MRGAVAEVEGLVGRPVERVLGPLDEAEHNGVLLPRQEVPHRVEAELGGGRRHEAAGQQQQRHGAEEQRRRVNGAHRHCCCCFSSEFGIEKERGMRGREDRGRRFRCTTRLATYQRRKERTLWEGRWSKRGKMWVCMDG